MTIRQIFDISEVDPAPPLTEASFRLPISAPSGRIPRDGCSAFAWHVTRCREALQPRLTLSTSRQPHPGLVGRSYPMRSRRRAAHPPRRIVDVLFAKNGRHRASDANCCLLSLLLALTEFLIPIRLVHLGMD